MNLTPFSTRRSTSSDAITHPPSDRQSSVPPKQEEPRNQPSIERSRRSTSDAVASNQRLLEQQQPPEQRSLKKKDKDDDRGRKKKVVYDDSSDSAHEPEGGDPDHSVVYKTSRATSPMDPDRDFYLQNKPQKDRRRYISRTKTKKYPKKVYRWRKDRPIIKTREIQVDENELDKYSGRLRINRDKFRDREKSSTSDKYTSNKKYQVPSTSSRPTSYSSQPSAPDRLAGSVSSRHSNSSQPVRETQQLKEIDSTPPPRQSKFKAKERPGQKPQTTVHSQSAARKPQPDTESDDEEYNAPQQSTYANWKLRQEKRKAAEKKAKEKNKVKVAALTPENLSLKDSIDKVKSWKRQLQQTPPETPIHSEAERPSSRSSSRGGDRRKHQLSWSASQDDVFDDEDEILQEPVVIKSKQPTTLMPNSEKSYNNQRRTIIKNDPEVVKKPLAHNKSSKKNSQRKITFRDERTPSPYDNIANAGKEALADRCLSPYDNSPKVIIDECYSEEDRMYPAKSRESLASFGGDISSFASDDDEEVGISRSQSMLSVGSMETHPSDSLSRKNKRPHLKSMESLCTSATSLPDVVTSSEGPREGQRFIGRVQDIDSLLDFSGTEDEMFSDEFSDEEYQTMNNRRNLKRQRQMDEGNLSPVDEYPRSGRRYESDDQYRTDDEIIYITDCQNINDVLGDDDSVYYCPSTYSEPPDVHKAASKKLSLQLPDQEAKNATSAESLLDTPVPDTPDVPLSPLPAFPFSLPQTEDYKQGGWLKPIPAVVKKSKSKNNKKITNQKAKSMTNLDDLDQLLDTIKVAGPKSKKAAAVKDEASTFDLFSREAKQDLREEIKTNPSMHTPQVSIDEVDDAVPTAQLIDVSLDNAESPVIQPMVTSQTTDYPDNYSDIAVKEALRLHRLNGHVSMSQLMQISQKDKTIKPPWVVEEEDKYFRGFANATEMLEDIGVDTKKVRCVFIVYLLQPCPENTRRYDHYLI